MAYTAQVIIGCYAVVMKTVTRKVISRRSNLPAEEIHAWILPYRSIPPVSQCDIIARRMNGKAYENPRNNLVALSKLPYSQLQGHTDLAPLRAVNIAELQRRYFYP
jgi:hypothetical protein